jgi:hypothetical protein
MSKVHDLIRQNTVSPKNEKLDWRVLSIFIGCAAKRCLVSFSSFFGVFYLMRVAVLFLFSKLLPKNFVCQSVVF